MKKMLTCLLLIAATFLACRQKKQANAYPGDISNLKLQEYEIDTRKDTILRTANGADILIKKNSIKASSVLVKLQVKEAYSIEDIVKAGLITRSGGAMLSSGGMVYINVQDAAATVEVPIEISLPSSNFREGMQLFKGEEDENGVIDWKDPQPILPNKTLDTINMGRSIFQNNCGSCHKIDKDATGPPLVFITQRRDRAWLDHFIDNSAQMIAYGDPYANCLYDRWNRTAMTAFPALSREELDALYRYLEEESENYDPRDFPDEKATFDSCQLYIEARNALLDRKAKLLLDTSPEVIKANNGNAALIVAGSSGPISWPAAPVVPKASTSTYYQFSISSFGWYNIDIFTKNLRGFEKSILTVQLKGSYVQHTNIYLVIPSEKIFVDGGLLKGETLKYGFFESDASIPLPQGKQAYILAFSEIGDQLSFAATSFTTSINNQLELVPELVHKEVMNQRVKELNLEQLSIEVNDTKKSGEMRQVELDLKNVELLKPQNADCNCGLFERDSIIFEDGGYQLL